MRLETRQGGWIYASTSSSSHSAAQRDPHQRPNLLHRRGGPATSAWLRRGSWHGPPARQVTNASSHKQLHGGRPRDSGVRRRQRQSHWTSTATAGTARTSAIGQWRSNVTVAVSVSAERVDETRGLWQSRRSGARTTRRQQSRRPTRSRSTRRWQGAQQLSTSQPFAAEGLSGWTSTGQGSSRRRQRSQPGPARRQVGRQSSPGSRQRLSQGRQRQARSQGSGQTGRSQQFEGRQGPRQRLQELEEGGRRSEFRPGSEQEPETAVSLENPMPYEEEPLLDADALSLARGRQTVCMCPGWRRPSATPKS